MAAHSVLISVEAPNEHQIQEVTLDGQEIYVQPLSMSENLTKLAHKIDFYKDETAEKGKPTSEGEKVDKQEKEPEKVEEKPAFQPSLWPWDNVRNKLKSALSEVSVLHDILAIAREKKFRYMVLDPVEQESTDTKLNTLILAKKKGLANAGQILTQGADRLKKCQSETSLNRSNPDFHTELARLRQNWRLKKVGNVILGDLSYKSAGSRFRHAGTFEVRKADTEDSETSSGTSHKGALEVIIPSELEGVAYIQVAIKHSKDSVVTADGSNNTKELASATLTTPTANLEAVPTEAFWEQRLQAAQNVIFCKELFSHLAREAVQSQSAISHVVIGKQIISNILPGVQLSISYCHYTGKDKKTSGLLHRPDHDHVLEHSLHQLLRELHYKNIHYSMPHPSTSMLGVTKRRRIAGPTSLTRDDLQDMRLSETVLEQIIKQARHTVLRLQTQQLLDELSRLTVDPLISCHWNHLNSALETTVKVTISTARYEQMIRTSVVLHIGTDGIRAVCKDGRVIQLSTEEQELRDLILIQTSQHQICALQSLAKMMNWHVLSMNTNTGCGDQESLGNASTIMLSSPSGHRVLSVRSGPLSGVQVCVQAPDRPLDDITGTNTLVTNPKWLKVGGEFKSVNLMKMSGRTAVAKMESIMAEYSGLA